MRKLRYWFKWQWREPEPVEIIGDFCFHMKEKFRSGLILTSFIGAGYAWILELLLLGIVLHAVVLAR